MRKKQTETVEELADLLAAALPPPTLPYNPAVEITALDLAKRSNWSTTKAQMWLKQEVQDGRWQMCSVMVEGRKARAYRPVGK